MFNKPIIPQPPWKDAYHHFSHASIVILGLYLGLTWPDPQPDILLGFTALAATNFLLAFLYYAPMWCYSPTRFWVIAAISVGLYAMSGVLEPLDIWQTLPAVILMVLTDRLLNYLLAFVRIHRT